MRQSTRLILNASVNVVSGLVNMAVRLVVVPLTIYYIGKEAYGVYALVAGLTLYTPYLRMGMASAVGRYAATHLARGEYDELNAVVNTGVAYYRVMALLFVAVAVCIALWGIEWFIHNPDLHRVACWCVVIFGLVEGMAMFLGPVGGALWAIERFDLFSLPVTVFRLVRLAALAAILPFCDDIKTGLVAVTTVMVLTNFLPALARRLFVARYTPNLRFDMRLARAKLVWPLLSFGVGTITWNWAQMLLNYLPLLLIGYYLTTEHVAEYEVPASVLLLVNMLIKGILMVMLPTASKLTATDRGQELQTLFLRSSKYGAGASMVACAGIGVLAPVLLYVWVGETFLHVAVVLTVLAVGHALFFVQHGSFYVLVGMARQRVPAIMTVVAVALMGLAQAVVLARTDWGLPGVAGVTAATLVLAWGLAVPIYTCRQVGVKVRRYYAVVLIRPVLACLPVSAVWLGLRYAVPLSQGWMTLVAALSSGAVLAGLSWWFVLFDDWDRRLAREKVGALRDRLRSIRTGHPAVGEVSVGGEPPEDDTAL